MQKTWEMPVQPLDWEDPQEGGMATHSSILGWRIPWTEEPTAYWQATVHSAAQSQTRLKWLSTQWTPWDSRIHLVYCLRRAGVREELEQYWPVRKHSSEWWFSGCSVSVWKVSQDRFQGRGYQGYHLKSATCKQWDRARAWLNEWLPEPVSKAPYSVIDASHSKKIWHSISRLEKQKQQAHWDSTVLTAWGVPGTAWELSKHDLTVTQFCRMGIAIYAPRCHGLNCESVSRSVVPSSLQLHRL